MKYTTLLLLVIIAGTVSCRKTRVNDRRVTTLDATYRTGSGIDTTNINGKINYKTVASNTMLFGYTLNSDIPGAYDAAVGSSLTFMVDSGVTVFSYSNTELERRHTYYSTFSAWGGSGTHPITKGVITGYKDGNKWQVTINVELPVQDNVTNNNNINTTATFIAGPML